MAEERQTAHKIEAMPICRKDGAREVHLAASGKHVGFVQALNGYTKSGWDEGIAEDIPIDYEAHALQQDQAVMARRFRQVMLDKMPPASEVEVVQISRGGVS